MRVLIRLTAPIEALLLLSGANSVRHNATVTGHSETGSHLSDSTSFCLCQVESDQDVAGRLLAPD
jgi:hypothetical protein